jgi:hypothetical protein
VEKGKKGRKGGRTVSEKHYALYGLKRAMWWEEAGK